MLRLHAAVLASTIAMISPLAAQTPAGKTVSKSTAKTAPSALSKVPAAVAAAFTQAYPNAKVLHTSKENEEGAVEYEIECLDGAIHRDVDYTPEGVLIEVEEGIGAADVPNAVSKAILARYPKATITRREKITTKAGQVSYEFGVRGAGPGEIILNPDGSWVTPKMAGKSGKTRP